MSELTLSDDAALAVPDHVLTRRAGGETVLMSLENERYYSLDGVGNRMWELVESGATFGSVIGTLFDEFEVSRDMLVSDMTSLLTDLVGNGLVIVNQA